MPVVQFTNPPPIDCTIEQKYLATFKGGVSSKVRADIANFFGVDDPDIVLKMQTTDANHGVGSPSVQTATTPPGLQTQPSPQTEQHDQHDQHQQHDQHDQYADLLLNTSFALCPRGDALFSYRFTEALSAGAIPVVMADGWVLPFSEILDYSEFAVVIPEAEYQTIKDVLRGYSAERVCAMRNRAREVYERHFRSLDAQMHTLLQLLQTRAG
jgi:hypothetical protein